MTDFPASFVAATCDELLAHINACHAVLLTVGERSGPCPCCGITTDGAIDDHRYDCALRACLDGKP